MEEKRRPQRPLLLKISKLLPQREDSEAIRSCIGNNRACIGG